LPIELNLVVERTPCRFAAVPLYEGVNILDESVGEATPLLEQGVNILDAGSGEATPLLA
jgi:hypothetical protein